MNREPLYVGIEELRAVLAGVEKRSVLASADGILKRGGIRHALLRVETIQILLSIACQHPDYQGQCRRIGRSAAKDFWEMIPTLHSKKIVILRSLDVLLAIWSHWDRTGGWGIVTFTQTGDKEAGKNIEYIASISNDFLNPLHSTDIYSIGDMHKFWAGYFEGFLDDTALHAYEGSYEAEPEDKARERIAQYGEVVSISVEDRDESPLSHDRFRIVLRRHRLLPLYHHLGRAFAALKSQENTNCVNSLLQALMWAEHNPITQPLLDPILEPDLKAASCLDDHHVACIEKLRHGDASTDNDFVTAAYQAMKALTELLQLRSKGGNSHDQ